MLGGILEAGTSLFTPKTDRERNEETILKDLFNENINNDQKTSLKHHKNMDDLYLYFSQFAEQHHERAKPIEYLIVIGFDHKIGSIVEFVYPEPQSNDDLNDEVLKSLTFLGLPDGSHSVDSDYSFFITPDGKGKLFYCVSCYRQIKSSELL